MERRLIFFTGGTRSGKSMAAQRRVEKWPGNLLYIATAEALDDEMRQRVRAHRADRGGRWDTLEEPLDLAMAVSRAENYGGALVDCLTLWTSNLMHAHEGDEAALERRVDAFIEALAGSRANIAVVTNEVGMGLVPENPLGRRFRDLAGMINRRVASVCDEAYLIVSGRALRLE